MGFLRQAGQWLAAAAIAMLLCNACLYGYHDPAAWIDRSNASTYAIWRPGSRIVMGTEGRGVHHVDSRGYLNPDLPLADGYTLVVGSSFTQGKEVAAGERFVDLLNGALSDGETLAVYSVSQDGFYFPDVVACFPALMAEFPDAETLIIEIGSVSFSDEALTAALNRQGVDETQRGAELLERMPSGRKAALYIKEAFPILTLGKQQLTAMLAEERASPETAPSAEALDAAMAQIRARFSGRIIIFYHPSVQITPEADLEIVQEEGLELFRRACERNGLEFLDASVRFSQAYEEDHTVPYGFPNTTMGSGHLNADGHRICAELLLEALKGGEA